MEEETKNEPVEPKEDGWAEKAKKLIDKTDEFIDEKVDKVKKSKAFGEIKESLDKAEEYVDDKIEDIRKTTADKLEDLAGEIRKKTKDEQKPEDPEANPHT
jgi:ElaB/YqjD/DUF883 family membrane-anchored ribosome-binding protein